MTIPGTPFVKSPAVRVLAAVVLLAAARPAPASWVDKSQPVPDWGLAAAKTPTPDYAKDSGSVILSDEYLETIDGQGRATEREREVMRILQPQDRQIGCVVSYDVDDKINYFREWTIAADGKVFQAKDTDFVDKGGETGVPVELVAERERIVHPPAGDLGATVVCESEELLAPYEQEKVWQIQNGIPVVFEALEVDLPSGRAHSASWHEFKPVNAVEVAPNHWRWEVRDEQKLDLRDVKASLDWDALVARMYVSWGDAAVAGTDNQWRAWGLWCTHLEEHRPDPTPDITAEAQKLVAGAPDFYAKVKEITEYIQENIRYFVVERGIGGLQAHYAGDIFRNRYGDCKDKATLLISMLQAVGIPAYYVPVDSRRGVVDPLAPSLYGDHMIAAIEVPADVKDPRLEAVVTAKDGKRYLIFDATDERTPAGNLPSYLQGGYGILSAGPESQVIALPVLAPDANGTERKGTFTLSADGALTGKVDTLHSGPEGADFRMFIKYTDDKERNEFWEKYVARDLPGVALDSFDFVQPSSLDKPMEFHYAVTVPQYAHTAGPLLLVRPRVVGEDSIAFDDHPRAVPIDLEATGRWRDSFDITLPPGYVVDEFPDPIDMDMDFASYHSSVSAKGNVLHYEREYVVRQVEIPASKADDFRKLEGAILTDEKGAVVLKKQ
ncbi:MAG: transglutaminase domain-containing protein [Terracidiphilus sp.]